MRDIKDLKEQLTGPALSTRSAQTTENRFSGVTNPATAVGKTVADEQNHNYSVEDIVTSLIEQSDEEAISISDVPTDEQLHERALLDILAGHAISVHDDIPADVNTLSIGGVDTFAREGLHFVKAKAKQGKTSALAIIESVYISSNGGKWGLLQRIGNSPLKVRHIDTEQKPYDTQQFTNKVFNMAGTTEDEAGDNYRVYNFRTETDNDRKKELIYTMLKHDPTDVLVIDGVVDLMDNFNEIDDSKNTISWLMQIATEFKIVLFCVLHTNKNIMDHNMRGHFGTMADQKCDNTLECEKDEKSSIVTVKCTASRHRPFPKWSFTWDNDGNLIDAEKQRTAMLLRQAEETKAKREKDAQKVNESRKDTMLSILNAHNGSMTRAEMTTELKRVLSLSDSSVSPLITAWVNDKVIFQYGKIIQNSSQLDIFNEK